jgi:hypothetical protein
MFQQRNIHTYTWTSPEGKTHDRIDHILIDRRWHWYILDVRSFRAADCDTGLYVVVVKFKGILTVIRQGAQRFNVERINLSNTNVLEVRNKYHIKIANNFAVLNNLRYIQDINVAWENIKKILKHQLKIV